MKKSKIFIFMVITIITLLTVGACKKSSDSVPVLAYQDRVGDASAILTAKTLSEQAHWSTLQFSSGSLTAEALISGNADIATMGDAVAVNLAARYPETIVLLGAHGGGALRHRLVSRVEEPGTIGVKFGTSTHAALLAWLELQGLSPQSTTYPTLLDLSPDLQISALASKEIDAIAASEPTPSVAVSKIAGLMTTSLQIPQRNFPIVLVSTKKAVKTYTSEITSLISALKKQAVSLQGTNIQTLPAESVLLLSQVTGLAEPTLMESLRYHTFTWLEPEELTGELAALAEFLYSAGTIPSLPDWEAVLPAE